MNGRYALLVDRTCVFDPLLDFLLAYLHRESAVRQQYIHNVVELPATGYCTSAVVQKIQKKRVQLEGFASAAGSSAKVTQPKQSRGTEHFVACFLAAQKNKSTPQGTPRPPPPFTNEFMLMEGHSCFVRGCFGKRSSATNDVRGSGFRSLTGMSSFLLSVEFLDVLQIEHYVRKPRFEIMCLALGLQRLYIPPNCMTLSASGCIVVGRIN